MLSIIYLSVIIIFYLCLFQNEEEVKKVVDEEEYKGKHGMHEF